MPTSKMKAYSFSSLFGFALIVCAASAEDKPVPELTQLQGQYDAKVMLDVLQPYDLARLDLNTKYIAALERELDTAQKAGKLEEAVAIKEEKLAVSSDKGVPAQDEEKTTPALKQLRAAYRTAIARLDLDREKKLKPLKDALAKSLDTLVLKLTKDGKLEDAMAVKKKREELGSAGTATEPALVVGAGAAKPGALSGTKDKPFVNTLGMKFVPVPGTQILMCIHETLKKDYAAYAAENPGVNGLWNNANDAGVPVSDGDDHPVVSVSYDDATAFCEWLGKKEGKTYRLPTDREWSVAVGIGTKERPKGATPASLNGMLKDVYPCEDKWPPPKGAGNYADTATKEKMPARQAIPDYTDGFPTTAPVMSFKPNKLGIYDLGGNVWEWCEDWFDAAQKERALRGGSWSDHVRDLLVSSYRHHLTPDDRHSIYGFRVVVVTAP